MLNSFRGSVSDSRVLVVDDHDDSRTVARIVLEHAGYEVYEAATGIEAVQQALALTPAVILMDIALPKIDGLEAARRIRAHPRTNRTRIIAVTALGRGWLGEEARSAKCNAFLEKPFHIETLRKVVAEQVVAARRSAILDVIRNFAGLTRFSPRRQPTKGQYQAQ
jgi:CheY-like chemotaxis protein